MVNLNALLSPDQLARKGHVTRQSIYAALRNGRLTGIKCKGNWRISSKDYDEYRARRGERRLIHQGKLLHDPAEGRWSIPQLQTMLADRLRRPYSWQRIYYHIRAGKLRAERIGHYWLILDEDAQSFIKLEIEHYKGARDGANRRSGV